MTREKQAATLRAQLATADRSGAGKPFPERLRREVVQYARAGIDDGESLGGVARDLGISAMSIKRWLGRVGSHDDGVAELRRVASRSFPSAARPRWSWPPHRWSCMDPAGCASKA